MLKFIFFYIIFIQNLYSQSFEELIQLETQERIVAIRAAMHIAQKIYIEFISLYSFATTSQQVVAYSEFTKLHGYTMTIEQFVKLNNKKKNDNGNNQENISSALAVSAETFWNHHENHESNTKNTKLNSISKQAKESLEDQNQEDRNICNKSLSHTMHNLIIPLMHVQSYESDKDTLQELSNNMQTSPLSQTSHDTIEQQVIHTPTESEALHSHDKNNTMHQLTPNIQNTQINNPQNNNIDTLNQTGNKTLSINQNSNHHNNQIQSTTANVNTQESSQNNNKDMKKLTQESTKCFCKC